MDSDSEHWGIMPDGISVNYRAPCIHIHIHTLMGKLVELVHLPRDGRKQENLQQTHAHAILRPGYNPNSESNYRLGSCEAALHHHAPFFNAF